MRTRKRVKVAFGDQPFRLGNDGLHHVGHGDAVFEVARVEVPPAVCRQLVADAAHPRPFQAETQHAADFVQVDVVVHRADQRATDVVFPQYLQRGQLGFQQRFAAQRLVRRVVQAVELKVDFEPVAHLGQLRNQGRIVRKADAVGVNHHRQDRLLVGVAHHAHQIRVQRRFAARQLQHIGDAFQADVTVYHSRVRLEVDVLAAGSGLGETHWTFQIAIGRNFDEADAGVLFVFGTKPAVVGAALVGAGAVGARRTCGLAEFAAVVVGNVGADEVFDEAVFGAALTEVDAAVADDDFGVHQATALRTKTPGGPEKGVVAHVHGGSF